MEKKLVISLIVLITILGVNCPSSLDIDPGPAPEPGEYTVQISLEGKPTGSSFIYAAWIEDEAGNDIQNLYVCNRVLGIGKTLTGIVLPNWKTVKYAVNSDVDGVTGASTQPNKTIMRDVHIGSVRKFHVCFEIDRSWNDNEYFHDRPAFTYRSDLVNLDDLHSPYDMTVYGWMSNDTGDPSHVPPDSEDLSQQPIKTISDFAQYTLMPHPSYIEPQDDMVSSLSVTIIKN